MMATLRAPVFFKAMNSLQNKPLHPDPEGPILNTRSSPAAMGQGYYHTTIATRHGRGHGRGYFPSAASTYAKPYHTTTKTPRVCVCARARLRMHGIINFFGSMVVDTLKSLGQKRNRPYHGPYHAPYHGFGDGRGSAKSLKTFKMGGF